MENFDLDTNATTFSNDLINAAMQEVANDPEAFNAACMTSFKDKRVAAEAYRAAYEDIMAKLEK